MSTMLWLVAAMSCVGATMCLYKNIRLFYFIVKYGKQAPKHLSGADKLVCQMLLTGDSVTKWLYRIGIVGQLIICVWMLVLFFKGTLTWTTWLVLTFLSTVLGVSLAMLVVKRAEKEKKEVIVEFNADRKARAAGYNPRRAEYSVI